MKSMSLFLYGEPAVLRLQAAESRVLQDIPRGQGCRLLEKRRRRGEIRFNELRARSPQTRDRVFLPLALI